MSAWRQVGLWALWVAGLVGLGRHDERVSGASVDATDSVANFVADYGELPGLALTAFALHVALTQVQNRLARFALAVGLGGAVGYLFLTAAKLRSSVPSGFIAPMVVTFGAFILIGHQILKPAAPAFAVRSRFVDVQLRFALVVMSVVMGLKWLWGRPRFRELEPGVVDFVPWYEPLGITGFQSFPSGHVAVAWLMLSCVLLVPATKPRARSAVMLMVLAWGLVVAWARVRIGAHWLSDVWFSTGLCWLAWGWSLRSVIPAHR